MNDTRQFIFLILACFNYTRIESLKKIKILYFMFFFNFIFNIFQALAFQPTLGCQCLSFSSNLKLVKEEATAYIHK